MITILVSDLCMTTSRLGPVPQGCSGVGGCRGVPDEKDGLEGRRRSRQEPGGYGGADRH